MPMYYDDDHEGPNDADRDYPDYQIVQLSPADLQMMADMEADLHSEQQAKALQEQVWLEPATPEMRYPAYPADYPDYTYSDQNELQPSYQTSAVHKKDKEHLQYQPDLPSMARVRMKCLCSLLLFIFLIF